MNIYLSDILFNLPEIFLVTVALLLLVEGAIRQNADLYHLRRFGRMAFLSLLFSIGILILVHKPGERWGAFEGQLVHDDFVYVAQLLVLLGSAAVLKMSFFSLGKEQILSCEYFALVLFATVGMLCMVAANDLLSLFVSMEVQGLSLYILCALQRESNLASEAALKYFTLGAVATCLYLYGASFLYGVAGTTNFDALTVVIQGSKGGQVPLGLIVGFIFILASFSFKASFVPFHMWTPDVYEGCPTAITAFVASIPKVATILVVVRLLLISPFKALYGEWQFLILILSCISMLWGAFAALDQTNLKRLLAYSTISQMGYVLMGIAVGNHEGAQAVSLYMVLYLGTVVGVFACLLCLRGKGTYSVETLGDLAGIGSLHPRISCCLALFMFSLAGLPPLAGFFGKLYIFKAALSKGLFELVGVGVLASVMSAYYYLKVVKVMYFDSIPESPAFSYGQTVILSLPTALILNLCVLITAFFFVYPTPLLELIQKATFMIAN